MAPPRDLDGRSSSLAFRSAEEQALWARLVEAAFSHGLRTHGSLDTSIANAITTADRLVVELRERSGNLARQSVLEVPAGRRSAPEGSSSEDHKARGPGHEDPGDGDGP